MNTARDLALKNDRLVEAALYVITRVRGQVNVQSTRDAIKHQLLLLLVKPSIQRTVRGLAEAYLGPTHCAELDRLGCR